MTHMVNCEEIHKQFFVLMSIFIVRMKNCTTEQNSNLATVFNNFIWNERQI